jgi:hypothetical protein
VTVVDRAFHLDTGGLDSILEREQRFPRVDRERNVIEAQGQSGSIAICVRPSPSWKK